MLCHEVYKNSDQRMSMPAFSFLSYCHESATRDVPCRCRGDCSGQVLWNGCGGHQLHTHSQPVPGSALSQTQAPEEWTDHGFVPCWSVPSSSALPGSKESAGTPVTGNFLGSSDDEVLQCFKGANPLSEFGVISLVYVPQKDSSFQLRIRTFVTRGDLIEV